MQLIPVIDLLDGHAVRAERGQRERYRPIRSSLAATSEPVEIARALVAACAASTLYVADLGAILQRGAHAATLDALVAALPGVAIWIDAGFDSHPAMRAYFDTLADASRVVPVFGTESLRDPLALAQAERDGFAPILSLDRRAGEPLTAAAAIDDRPDCWPQRVISMTLDHVGSYAGPDLATLAKLRKRARRGTQLIGAGGIRDRDDLRAARASGAHAWLVASALHDRHLDETALA